MSPINSNRKTHCVKGGFKVKKVQIGVIGTGRIGKIHIKHLVSMPEVKVKSIADLYIEQVTDWARQLGIPHLTKNYREILADPEIDAVLVCTHTHTHAEMIQAAAEAKKHIFCEKPISFELESTLNALKAVEKHHVKLQVGFMRRFDHNFRRVYDCVKEGKIGTPHIVRITSRDPEPSPKEYILTSGGMPFDMTIHDYDMARFLTNSEVEEVYVQGAVLIDEVFAECGDIDTAVTTLRFQNGAIGIIDNSRKAAYGYDQRVEVFGSKGSIAVDNDFDNTAIISTAEGIYQDKPKYFFLERYQEAFRTEMKAFIQSIANDEKVLVDGNDGLQAELIAHTAARSIQEKRPVTIQEIKDEMA